jgi:hypothetical protein
MKFIQWTKIPPQSVKAVTFLGVLHLSAKNTKINLFPQFKIFSQQSLNTYNNYQNIQQILLQ